MQPLRCLDCGSDAWPTSRFCARCGQRTDTGRLRFADVVRDLMQSLGNVERGPLRFAVALLTGPGTVASEYVEGKRRRHYGPFATLAVLVGMTALVINSSGIQMLAQDGLPAGPAAWLERHFNLLLLMQLPLLAAVCALVSRDGALTLPEHMVLSAYTMSVRAIVVALGVPLAFLTSKSQPGMIQVYGFWVAWYAYFGWAASQFYAGSRLSSWLRGSAAAGITHGITVAALTSGGALIEHLMARH